MCYAIPGRVVSIKGQIAVVDYFGEQRTVLNDNDDIQPGDYVYAQGGILINKIAEKDAREILGFWKEKFFELKKIDAQYSKLHTSGEGELLRILQRVNVKQKLNNEEFIYLLNLQTKEEQSLLFETANVVRQKEHDNACCVHGIIEFSNYCRCDCFYCGLRKSTSQKRYRMTPEEIISAATYAVNELGFKALVLQSGEDEWYDEEKLVTLVKEIRKLNVLIFLSIGERSKALYKKLYETGARAVLLRFETSNKEIFQNLRPGTNLEQRLDLIRYAKELGYIVATGFLIGLPGETEEDILNNIMLTKSLGADMYSFGPLIPAAGTPLEKEPLGEKSAVLKTIAVTRLLDRKAKILVTTALETLGDNAKKEGLLAGANSLMINVTPPTYRDLYIIYPKHGKEVKKAIQETIDLLYSLGRAPTDLGL
ncbi:MAG: [FeFe] hydrogenase H-cluster radical SAM maturase HydE [Nanoarchaeota archaeon]|nr:[FeFe] hydrogenase H-cluster radical SAM maturase HydE [Nanoarchaeota archaeon]